MKSVGIFEAKTKFTALCEEVVRTNQAVVVSKCGKPMVMVSPVSSNRPDILTAWREWTKSGGGRKNDFPKVWNFRRGAKSNPLAE